MYFVYVLFSRSYSRIYIGMTHDLSHRLTEHNTGMNRSTAPYIPWEIVHFEKFETRALAHQKELKLKTSSGRRFIRKNYLTLR